jgi:hypothetical protein
MARCARCDREFTRRRSDHRFCGPVCRKLGEPAPWDPPAADPDTVDRLFDEQRDPDELCTPDDWYPIPWTDRLTEIYLCQPSACGRFTGDTVARRRRHFNALHPDR